VEQGDWESGVVYAVGDRVQWHAATWACHTTHTSSGSILPSNASYWGKVPDFEYSIEYAGTDSGGTRRPVIGRMKAVCAVDPRANLAASEFETENTATGIRFYNLTVARPWITYRVKCPDFTGDAWSAASSYTAAAANDAVWGI
jgi:hypothetical protein